MPKLLIEETTFEFSVEQYVIMENYDWSSIRLGVENSYMHYDDCGELLDKYEVDEIIEKLEALLCYKIAEREELRFTEPDITMCLYPARINVSNKSRRYRDGYDVSECLLDITLHFRNSQNEYVAEEWTITLDRKEIIALLKGLKEECGKS